MLAQCALPFGFIIANAARDARKEGQKQNQKRNPHIGRRLQVGAFVIACSSISPLCPCCSQPTCNIQQPTGTYVPICKATKCEISLSVAPTWKSREERLGRIGNHTCVRLQGRFQLTSCPCLHKPSENT